MVALSGFGQVDIEVVMAQYDTCIIAAHNFKATRNDSGVSVYEQAKLAIERLLDPVLLSKDNRARYARMFADNLPEICKEIARHDDRRALDELAGLGILNAGNLQDVIDEISTLQDVATTAYLLEMKRRRFGGAAIDFDL